MNATYDVLRSQLVHLLIEQRSRWRLVGTDDLTRSVADVLTASSPKDPNAYPAIFADAEAIVGTVFPPRAGRGTG